MMITQGKIDKLKATVSHCSAIEGLSDEYLTAFAEPDSDGGECLCCGQTATFTWGLAHGEGYCYKCGWPARLYHYIKDADGKESQIVRLLQYHPDGISLGPKT